MSRVTPRTSADLFPRQMTIIAHRGGAHEAPENTRAAFERALMGNFPIELDVRPTKDGRLVVFHDATLERTTDGAGQVAALTVEQLKILDAGNGERIQTLKEVLELVAGRVPIIIEVKSKGWRSQPRRLARMVVCDILDAKSEENTVVASFDWRVVRCVRQQMPHVLRALIFAERSFLMFKLGYCQADIAMPKYNLVTKDFVDRMHARRLRVLPWTVDQTSDAHRLIADGVDGLISNCPRSLTDELATSNATERPYL